MLEIIMRQPGIEPGLTPWEGVVRTTRPLPQNPIDWAFLILSKEIYLSCNLRSFMTKSDELEEIIEKLLDLDASYSAINAQRAELDKRYDPLKKKAISLLKAGIELPKKSEYFAELVHRAL